MKKTITMMVAMLFATNIFAQQTQSDIRTATLIHGNQTSIFYGVYAFSEAYEAAAKEGDIIVLSPGQFNSIIIKKSVSIYGAGYENDPISGAEPTSLVNDVYIQPYEDYDEMGNNKKVCPKVHLEGLKFRNLYDSGDVQIEDLVVRKCGITNVDFRYANSKNCKISQCYISGNIICSPTEHNQLVIENSWVGNVMGSTITSTITYDHCILRRLGLGGYAHFTNNIILGQLYDNCTAYNNIFTVESMGSNITGEGNWTGVGIDGIFIDAEKGATYSADNDFALRFPAKYVGTDGTEVGINGGNAPFDRISPLPRILSSNIDLHTSADGKLNVSIEVEAQTKE